MNEITVNTWKGPMVVKAGTPLYLYQMTNNCWVNDVRRPYTVVAVSDKEITIQEALCIFNGPRYYDTLADDIVPNPNGRIRVLKQSNAKKYKGLWVDKLGETYPYIAEFGEYDYYPYLN